ncbi:MAG: hypothetical protein IT508_00530 [Burkholderiaceae bacterium]|nr:hypothetical protein [Burkholderiaceae bacterium]
MAPIDPQPTSAPASVPPRRSTDWPAFAQRLASALGALQEDQYLVVSLEGTNRYVQFAGQGHWGLRAECVSTQYLSGPERLDERQLARLRELGWHEPTGSAPESTPERDPDGSPNHFVEWPAPAAVAALAALAVTTLVDVLDVAHPGFLEYKAFDSQERTLVFDQLGLRRVTPPTGTDLVADLEHRLLATVREITGLCSLEYDHERDIGFAYGRMAVLISLIGNPVRVRLRALLLTDLEGSPALLERLNDFNAGLGSSLHLFFHRGAVRAVSDLPAWPFVPEHVEHALEEFCPICDGLNDLLQAEFGGDSLVIEETPSATLH